MAETKKSDRYTEHMIESQPREKRRGQTLTTRSHDVIQKWAQERGAQPATVQDSHHQGHVGVLRLDFPGYGGQGLKRIDWDEWFKAFDARELCFVYQEHKIDGRQSNFFRLELSA